MDKFEAFFEEIEGLGWEFEDKSIRKETGGFKDQILNGFWELWQSRQAEINQLQSQINEMAEVGLIQESAIREKDKRIEEALKEIFNCRVIGADRIYTCDVIEKALRGEHE